MASRRFLSRRIAAAALAGLFPLFAQAGVIVFNGAEFTHTMPDAAAHAGFSLQDSNDAAWLTLPVAQADAQAVRAVEVPDATELTGSAIIATAIGLVILATRRKKKADDGRQSLWGALGNAPPVAGM